MRNKYIIHVSASTQDFEIKTYFRQGHSRRQVSGKVEEYWVSSESCGCVLPQLLSVYWQAARAP